MKPEILLHHIGALVCGVLLPTALMLGVTLALLRRERRLVSQAIWDARGASELRPEELKIARLRVEKLKDEMVARLQAQPRKRGAWHRLFLSYAVPMILLAMALQVFLMKTEWSVDSWGWAVLLGLALLYSVSLTHSQWWQRLVMVVAMAMVACGLQHYPHLIRWLSLALGPGILLQCVGTMWVHFNREWTSASEPSRLALPEGVLVVQRRYMLARQSLMALWMMWLVFCLGMYAWKVLLPAAHAVGL